MKRYHLFCMDFYYPSGGLGDYKGSFDTAEDAFKAGHAMRHDFFEVVTQDADGDLVEVEEPS
jgi:hypothetical protein